MKRNRLSFGISVACGLGQLCMFLIVFSICHTSHAGTNGRILIDRSSDGGQGEYNAQKHPTNGMLKGSVFQPATADQHDPPIPIEGADAPSYPELREALWGGVNNGDIFDEQGIVVDEMIDELAKANLRVLRVLIDYRLEMDEDGNPLPPGVYNDCILTWIDRLMLKAREKGMLLLISLQVHNWIINKHITISKENYEWRNCKTPYNVYKKAIVEGEQKVFGPYAERGWSSNYFISEDAKKAYKARVDHILNHYNHFFEKRWKDINDVVWAWGLHGEPELLNNSSVDVLRDWYNEMATHVKSIDPDTYVALGTKFADVAIDLGNIEDADIYTFHAYEDISYLEKDIQDFQEKIGNPYGKLLLVEEFNPGAYYRHTPNYQEEGMPFEEIMEVCRRNGVPWMFWEHGYQFDDDDIWHANTAAISDIVTKEEPLDGVFWGAKVLPGLKESGKRIGIGLVWGSGGMFTLPCPGSVPNRKPPATSHARFISSTPFLNLGRLAASIKWSMTITRINILLPGGMIFTVTSESRPPKGRIYGVGIPPKPVLRWYCTMLREDTILWRPSSAPIPSWSMARNRPSRLTRKWD